MAESSRPSNKRKASIISNVAATPASETPTLEKSPDFWIDDGNVILRTVTKQYRIHRGVLAMHSSVFTDIFSIPQPSEQQTVGDAPIIEVTDSADDWDALLPVIYGTKSMYEPDLGTTIIPVSLLVAMLRLGRKYDLERFKREALKQLEKFFPDSLKKWDRLFEDSFGALQDIMGDSVLELVHTAQELNIRRALPFGFFTCIREQSMAKILSGADTKSGLSQETLNRLVLGKEGLIRAAAKNSMAWFFGGLVSDSCLSPKRCGAKIQRAIEQMARDPKVDFVLDPPTCTRQLGGLCSHCTKEATKQYLAGRQETFRLLPSFFGLEPWDQLTNDF